MCFLGSVILLRKVAIIKNMVPPINAIPGNPNTKDIPGLGNAPALSKAVIVNAIATYAGILVSRWKKGSTMKNNERGMLKYWIPPQEAFASPRRRPAPAAFTKVSRT
jgi:hypothetical protein